MAGPPGARRACAARWHRPPRPPLACATQGSPASRSLHPPSAESSMRSRTMPAKPATRGIKPSEPGPIAAYKALLKDYIDRRPAGMRARIAIALGKHKSFVSQLTNPIYPMPVPARHLSTIFEICHFSAEERKSFLKAYMLAHPARAANPASKEEGLHPRRNALSLEVPLRRAHTTQRALGDLVRQFVERVAELID